MKLGEKYKVEVAKETAANDVKCAFVTFRSMEGQARMLQAYKMGKCKTCCIMCCFQEKVKGKLFREKWLKVDEAPNPSLIMWENLGYSRS